MRTISEQDATVGGHRRQLASSYDAAVAIDPATLINTDRYPIADLTDPRTVAIADDCREHLATTGVAIVPDFLNLDALAAMVAETARLAPGTHHQDVCGTPYLELPSPDWPADHPRLTQGRSALTAIPYDDFDAASQLRALYEWDALMHFIALALGKDQLFRYDDDLGALNVASMADGDELFWHFDQTDFVVSIALQSSEAGGDFECVSMLREPDDEHYDDVAAVLAGSGEIAVTTVPMTPGTLMFFAGRQSLHQVTPIRGSVPRYVALLAYDTKPGTCSSEILRLVRYGRAEAHAS